MAIFPPGDSSDYLSPIFSLDSFTMPTPRRSRSHPKPDAQRVKQLRQAVSKSASNDIEEKILAMEMARTALEQVPPKNASKRLYAYGLFIKVILNSAFLLFPKDHRSKFLDYVIVMERSPKPQDNIGIVLNFLFLASQGRCEPSETDALTVVAESLVYLQNGLKDSPQGFNFFATLLRDPFFHQLPIKLPAVLSATPSLMTENCLVRQVVDRIFTPLPA